MAKCDVAFQYEGVKTVYLTLKPDLIPRKGDMVNIKNGNGPVAEGQWSVKDVVWSFDYPTDQLIMVSVRLIRETET
jgi:hypothetical protein